jgi:hypothetical protein
MLFDFPVCECYPINRITITTLITDICRSVIILVIASIIIIDNSIGIIRIGNSRRCYASNAEYQ